MSKRRRGSPDSGLDRKRRKLLRKLEKLDRIQDEALNNSDNGSTSRGRDVDLVPSEIQVLNKERGEDLPLVQTMSDVGKLLTDLFYTQSTTRRELVSLGLKKEVKETLIDAEMDGWLFGENLEERIRAVRPGLPGFDRTDNKVSIELKSFRSKSIRIKDIGRRGQITENGLRNAGSSSGSVISIKPKDNLESAIVDWMAKKYLPFNFFNDEDTQNFFKEISGEDFPKQNKLRRLAIFRFDCLQKKMIDLLTENSSKLSFTIDGWTSISGRSYYGITTHFIDKNWELQSITLDFIPAHGKHTGKDIALTFFKSLDDKGLRNKLQGITMDNASANTSFIRELQELIPDLNVEDCHFRCFAHVINLAVQDLLKLLKLNSEANEELSDDSVDEEADVEEIENNSNAICKIRSIFSRIKRSEQLLIKFRSACEATSNSRKLTPVLDVPTRWNSSNDMLQVALKGRHGLGVLCQNVADLKPYTLGDEEWILLEEVHKLLSNFQILSKKLGGDKYVTLPMVVNTSVKPKDNLESAIVDWMAKKYLPFNFFNDEDTQNFFKEISGEDFPKQNKLRRLAIFRFDCLQKKMIDLLTENSSKLSFTIDGWTSISGRSYYGITTHFIDKNWELQSITLDFIPAHGKHTGKDIALTFFKSLDDKGLRNKLQGITMDNASANTSFIRELQELIPDLNVEDCHFRCFAHVINLAVQDLLKLLKLNSEANEELSDDSVDEEADVEEIENNSNAICKIRSIFSRIKRSEQLLIKFRSACEATSNSRKLTPVLDVPTRWNSSNDMLQVALKGRHGLGVLCQNVADLKPYTLGDEEWILLEEVHKLLSNFQILSKKLGGDKYVTLPMVVVCINILIDNLESKIFEWEGKAGRTPVEEQLIVGFQAARDKILKHYQNDRSDILEDIAESDNEEILSSQNESNNSKDLKIDEKFSCFSDLEKRIKEYEDFSNCVFYRRDSVTIEKFECFQRDRDHKAASSYHKTLILNYPKDSAEYRYAEYLTYHAFQFVRKEFNNMDNLQLNFNESLGVYEEIISPTIKISSTSTSCSCVRHTSMQLPCRHIFMVRRKEKMDLFEESLCIVRWTNGFYFNTQRVFSEAEEIEVPEAIVSSRDDGDSEDEDEDDDENEDDVITHDDGDVIDENDNEDDVISPNDGGTIDEDNSEDRSDVIGGGGDKNNNINDTSKSKSDDNNNGDDGDDDDDDDDDDELNEMIKYVESQSVDIENDQIILENNQSNVNSKRMLDSSDNNEEINAVCCKELSNQPSTSKQSLHSQKIISYASSPIQQKENVPLKLSNNYNQANKTKINILSEVIVQPAIKRKGRPRGTDNTVIGLPKKRKTSNKQTVKLFTEKTIKEQCKVILKWLLMDDEIVKKCKVCNVDLDKTIDDDDDIKNKKFKISVGCDACLEWFHLKCVGLKRKPSSKVWICTSCKNSN
ncbi:unnamed protein product [Brassicogethes aeneus]|uniref:Zinc finger PHD-type domain-containing protein n=1 Tax=Brassicogethes aeneus TaxID=1431903 RepID=A0A9P0FKB9_BRAAE|nr:unnamed protein product [Brassicogethes aeneus]